ARGRSLPARPPPGAVGVARAASVSATFSAAVQPGTVSLTLKDAAGNPVPTGAVSYDAATNTATPTPSAALPYPATDTASVPPTDTATNRPTPSPWSFPPAAAPNGPFTIWNASAIPANATSTDTNAVELGVKFQSTAAGYITGVRFYK